MYKVKMFGRFFTIFILLVLISPSTLEALNKYERPKLQAAHDAATAKKAAEVKRQNSKWRNSRRIQQTQSQKDDTESDRLNVERATNIDRSVSNVERQITSTAEKYRSGSIWEEAASEQRFKEGSKWKFLKYPLALPTYVFRFFTWPGAIVSDYLVKKGVVKKVVNLISSKDRTFWVYPKFEFGFGYGLGTGIGMKHYDLFHRQYEFNASYMIHLNLNQEFSTYLKKDDVFEFAGHPVGFKALATVIHNYDAPYYGIGATSQQSSRSIYKIDAARSGGYLSYNLIGHTRLEGHMYFEWSDTSPGKGGGGAPSVNQAFAASGLPGFGRPLYYLRYGLSLNRNTVKPNVEPETGGVQEAAIYRYQGLGTTKYDYNEYDIGVTQYVRLFMPRHVFVVRNNWMFRQQTDGRIPFYRLSELDVYSPMRGFDLNRFTDRASVVLNLEYRYPVWKHLDGQFFFDMGRVFHTPADFSFTHFSYDGGLGLRLCTANYFLGRFQVGYGGEGVKILLSTGKEF